MQFVTITLILFYIAEIITLLIRTTDICGDTSYYQNCLIAQTVINIVLFFAGNIYHTTISSPLRILGSFLDNSLINITLIIVQAIFVLLPEQDPNTVLGCLINLFGYYFLTQSHSRLKLNQDKGSVDITIILILHTLFTVVIITGSVLGIDLCDSNKVTIAQNILEGLLLGNLIGLLDTYWHYTIGHLIEISQSDGSKSFSS